MALKEAKARSSTPSWTDAEGTAGLGITAEDVRELLG